jgi:tetratricopeptide (TPR) repeat protein
VFNGENIMIIPNSAYPENAIPDLYTTLIQSLCDIGESYYWLGRVEDAVRLLQKGMQVVDESEVRQQDQVKLLLQYGKMLIMRNFRSNSSYEFIWPTLLRAQKIAEFIGDERLVADTLSHIGQDHYYKKLNTDEREFHTALKNFQQALELREGIADERGKSESLFYIGLIYERQEQYDKALAICARQRGSCNKRESASRKR